MEPSPGAVGGLGEPSWCCPSCSVLAPGGLDAAVSSLQMAFQATHLHCWICGEQIDPLSSGFVASQS